MKSLTALPLFLLLSPTANAMSLKDAIDRAIAHFPAVAGADLDIAAAQAARGPAWKMFAPTIGATVGQTMTPISVVNVPGTNAPATASSYGGLVDLSFSPMTAFARKDATTTVEMAKVQKISTEVQAAQAAATLYIQVVFGREQVEVLQHAFLDVGTKLALAPAVQGDVQVKRLVASGISSFQTSLRTACGLLEGADVSFRQLVGSAPGGTEPSCEDKVEQLSGVPNAAAGDRLDGIDDLLAEIPIFPNDTSVTQLAATNPDLATTELGIALKKNAIREANWWTGITASIGAGPSIANTRLAVGALQSNNVGWNWSVTVPFSFHSSDQKKAAQLAYQSALKKKEAQKIIQVLSPLDTDFVQYFVARDLLCDALPAWNEDEAMLYQLEQTLDNHQPVDGSVLALAANLQQILGVWMGMNSNYQSGLNAIMDMHAKTGDIVTTKAWDTSQNPDQTAYCKTRSEQKPGEIKPL